MAKSSVDQPPQVQESQAESSVDQAPTVSEISTPGQPKPEAQHQAQNQAGSSVDQGWSSSWWVDGQWGPYQWHLPADPPATVPTRWQWQQPASDNASTWGAGTGATWVSSGPAEPGPQGPWPSWQVASSTEFAEYSARIKGPPGQWA